ncbi:MAG TPA: UDP-2,4-diacetamido-2,4,6-trideoxy-beta-L-altropyranose hydrolase [Cytophaga sp.]|jgi:UDP-2,4-diacetamido-2,4,6-trideoxy-beta-L-altropyranose hydrolase|nr:UDP-2,4-diacetamido-2,4,6-trideoxy-beta-L-altropyranose hydrolase [Cytophaga sp.]
MNKKRTIVFRADGNSEIGLGHVMRCIALCEMLKELFQLKFAIQNPSAAIQNILNTSVSDVIALPETFNYTQDANNFLSVISKEDLIVLDGYYFDAHYQKKIKVHCSKLIYIDDLVSGHQYADVIINHNGLVQAADYDAEAGTTFLLGTQYALVRKEFFDAKTDLINGIKNNSSISVLINLGGADPENVSLSILNTLLSKKDLYSITLIIGAANKNTETFKAFNAAANVHIKKGLSADEMIDEINRCTVAIVSCSTIAYEVSILNKPFVGVLTASNQQSNAAFFEKNKLALAIFDTKFTATALLKCIEIDAVKWNETLQNQRLFFDGKTIERFQQAFLTI